MIVYCYFLNINSVYIQYMYILLLDIAYLAPNMVGLNFLYMDLSTNRLVRNLLSSRCFVVNVYDEKHTSRLI